MGVVMMKANPQAANVVPTADNGSTDVPTSRILAVKFRLILVPQTDMNSATASRWSDLAEFCMFLTYLTMPC